MIKNPDVVIMCGGKGKRIARLTAKYGCKSLIPIRGLPALEYVLSAVRATTNGRLFLCIDRAELIPSVERILEKLQIVNVEIYIDKGIGTVHALYELQNKISTEWVFVLFGHHLITSEHLHKMERKMNDGVVVSFYPTSSDNLRKVTKTDTGVCKYFRLGDETVVLKTGEQYADAPYLVPKAYITEQIDAHVRSYEAIKKWHESGKSVVGVRAHFPHEFHAMGDLPTVRKFAKKLKPLLKVRRIRKLKPSKKNLYVLILSGPAGSGKSTIADVLRKVLPMGASIY